MTVDFRNSDFISSCKGGATLGRLHSERERLAPRDTLPALSLERVQTCVPVDLEAPAGVGTPSSKCRKNLDGHEGLWKHEK